MGVAAQGQRLAQLPRGWDLREESEREREVCPLNSWSDDGVSQPAHNINHYGRSVHTHYIGCVIGVSHIRWLISLKSDCLRHVLQRCFKHIKCLAVRVAKTSSNSCITATYPLSVVLLLCWDHLQWYEMTRGTPDH